MIITGSWLFRFHNRTHALRIMDRELSLGLWPRGAYAPDIVALGNNGGKCMSKCPKEVWFEVRSIPKILHACLK